MIRYIARHGQTAEHRQYAGDPLYTYGECPLSPLGIEQAHLLGRHMKEIGFAGKIVSSPLLRTMATAEAVAEETGCLIYPFGPIHEYFPTQQSYENFHGKTLEELRALFPHIAPDAELPYPWWTPQIEIDSAVVRARVGRGLDDLLSRDGFRDSDLLLIGHGASVGAMYRYFRLDTTGAFSYNCALSATSPDDPGFRPYCCDVSFLPYEKTTNNHRATRAEIELERFEKEYEPEIPLPDWTEDCRGHVLLHISDTASRDYPFYKKLIGAVRPDILLHTGDMADEVKVGRIPGTETEYRTKIRWLLSVMDASSASRIVIVPGNNDLPDAIREYCPRAEVVEKDTLLTLDGVPCRVGHAVSRVTWDTDWSFYGHGYTGERWDYAANAPGLPCRFNGCLHSHVVCLSAKRFFRIPDPGQKMVPPMKHVYQNIDINSVVTPFLNRASEEKDPSAETLYPFVDIYRDSQITDVLFDIFCQYSNTDSAVWTDYADKYRQKTENGVSVDYTDRYRGLYAFNRRFGVDPYAVWFDRCRQVGLHPWMSIRMNDCHCPDDDACFLRSDFFYEAREKGWMIGPRYGYYRWCFDYAVPEVRRRMLAYIAEQLDRYDVDGLELDFSREIHCFDYVNDPDCHLIMSDFLRQVRDAVRAAAEKHGHGIRIGIRLMRDVAQNKVFGFDVPTIVSEGLADLICVCPRWSTCDSAMPLEAWKAAFPGVEIAAGITDLVLTCPANAGMTPAVVAGYTLRDLYRGADSVYLFNFFVDPYDTEKAVAQNALAIHRVCGRRDTAASIPRRHIVTYQDTVPEGRTGYRPLPVASGDTADLSVDLGKTTSDREYAVIIGVAEGDALPPSVTVNGAALPLLPCAHGEVDPDSPPYCRAGTVLGRAVIGRLGDPLVRLQFPSGDAPYTVVYAEIEAY